MEVLMASYFLYLSEHHKNMQPFYARQWYTRIRSMYKKPPKHVQRIRLTLLYVAMTAAVIIVVALLVLTVANYHYNRDTGTFEQRGLIQLASTPSGATVEVDGRIISSRTTTKYSVAAGERQFRVWREGYQPWSLTTTINEGSLVWLNYIRLVPTDRPIQTLSQRYTTLAAATTAPNDHAMVVLPIKTEPRLHYIDITNPAVSSKELTLPAAIYAPTNNSERGQQKRTPATYSFDEWDESSRYVFMWRTLGSTKQLILVDTHEPLKSVNISREFSIPITAAQFSGRSGNTLYILSDGTIRRLNVSDGTISRALVSDVAQFTAHTNATVSYVSNLQSDNATRTIGVYRDGDDVPKILKTVTDKKAKLSVASATYYGTTYTAIAQDNAVTIYKGHYDKGMDSLSQVATTTLETPVDSIEFNSTGSHLLIRGGRSFASYTVDRKQFARATLAEGSSSDLFWLDPMHLGLIADGVLTMRDVDGTNVFELNTALADYGATFGRNGTYMYSFGKGDNGVSLQRIRMILP